MAEPKTPDLSAQLRQAVSAARDGWHVLRKRGPSQIQFWFIALAIGVAAGFAALLFRKGIFALQAFLYGVDDPNMIHSHAAGMAWWPVVLIPVCGGLIVGVILHWFTPDGRLRSVADVIEGSALHDGRVETKAGFASALASLITLSSGGSSGREGPVVHLAGVISSWVSERINADGITGRDLLGCAVAAAVSASFNAPIAGALFALEVVLRHFAVHAFAPIVIASVAGTVINRLEFGGLTEFVLQTPGQLQFYVELPAFLILGLISGLIAVVLMRSIFFAEDLGNHLQRKLSVPRWARPGFAGLLLGIIAIGFPHIIGVGYETTLRALEGDLLLSTAVIFTMVKVIAVAITIAGHMGGGMFSPSLMIGAVSGLAFGLIATGVLPDVSGTATLYAYAGMGAVTAAVLGAPISTTLIVFELTGDWQIGIAVMVSVSMSTALATRLVDRSFFLTVLERRGLHLAAGPQAYLLAMFRAERVMRKPDDPRAASADRCWEMIGEGLYLDINATLEAAMPIFDRATVPFLPVVSLTGENSAPELRGALFHVDALKAYNRALASTAAEEHS
ncbi:chloride channel protein [Marinibacterium profundimaris]|uniref:Voltage-gated chloride channel n=1 Tax=Marinibacterium profundimaris TaxID=1679460 RepID=A0A225NSQ2_9RHOB|nr:chloride channel protein [Marinibacterium profundimaris]OWU77964.1 voltage-gated chloride channel [Marinibacterium profundimaris]